VQFLAGNQPGGKDIGAQAFQHGRGERSRPATSLHIETERHAIHNQKMAGPTTIVNRKSIFWICSRNSSNPIGRSVVTTFAGEAG
jgi:hypothetical protein